MASGRRAALGGVAVALLLAGACGDRNDRSETGESVADPDTPTTVCDTSATAPVPSQLAEALRPPSTDTVRSAADTGGKVVLVVSSPATVGDVVKRYKAAIPAQGFSIDGDDDEGRE